MGEQIATVLIPCYVVQMNNQLFIQDEEIVGQILEVPCRNALIDDVSYWAVPVKDFGVFTTLDYILAVDDNAAQPTYDSFLVVRVRDKLSGNTWWIYGTKDNFITSCSTCCDSPPVPMPGTSGSFVIRIQPCQTICVVNTLGGYYAIWGLPGLLPGQSYFPFGSYNNNPLFPGAGNGYTTVAALLAFMNANWGPFVWTASVDNLTLFATGGVLNDNLCVSVIPLTPSF
jgi:hypothetical protein